MRATTTNATLAARGLSRRYGTRTVVNGVDLDLVAGRVTALLGPSGSGKSTLLRVLAGLEPVDAGVVAAGEDILSAVGTMVPPERRRIGIVFQDYALFPHLSARDNVAFGLIDLPKHDRAARALAWLDAVGLSDKADLAPHMLSGGEQQRVALARALAPHPRAVLLDEPFSGLDGHLRTELRDLTLKTLKATQAAVLIVTHDADEAMAMADSLAVLDRGRIAQIASPDTVWEAPANLAAAAALSPLNIWRGAVANGVLESPFGPVRTTLADGQNAVLAVRPAAFRFCAGSRVRVIDRRRVGDAIDLVLAPAERPDLVWRARLPGERAPAPGLYDLDLSEPGVFVFQD